MRRLLKPLLWSLVFLLLLLAVDQVLLQFPPMHPAHAAVVRFYRDFRSRLIGLASAPEPPASPAVPSPRVPETAVPPKGATAPQSVEAVIDRQRAVKPTTSPEPALPGPARRYVYSDDQGELQFADSLDEVPVKYREQAQPMGE